MPATGVMSLQLNATPVMPLQHTATPVMCNSNVLQHISTLRALSRTGSCNTRLVTATYCNTSHVSQQRTATHLDSESAVTHKCLQQETCCSHTLLEFLETQQKTLQHTATHCNTLQQETCCSHTLQQRVMSLQHTAAPVVSLQYTATQVLLQ